MKFNNKNVVISGGSTGIGAATAKLFSKEGATVWVLDIVPLSYSDSNVHFIQCDVTEYEAMKLAIENIYSQSGKIDIMFANAGVHLIASIEDTSLDQIDMLINTNIKGIIFLLKLVLPHMKKQGVGKIVLMGSDQSFVGKNSSSLYGLTKGAIAQLTKSTALDYATSNIQVNCVCPGTIETPIADRAIAYLSEAQQLTKDDIYKSFCDAQPMKRMGQPEEVANLVAFLSSDESAFITGALIAIDGGYTVQ